MAIFGKFSGLLLVTFFCWALLGVSGGRDTNDPEVMTLSSYPEKAVKTGSKSKFDPDFSLRFSHDITVDLFEKRGGDISDEHQSSPKVLKEKKPEIPYRIQRVKVTAYCPCRRGSNRDGITANGKSAWTKGIACDWSFLPEDSIVSVPGYGTHIVDDKGGMMKRKHWKNGIPRIDIRMTYHWEAKQWGVKYLPIEIIRYGKEQ